MKNTQLLKDNNHLIKSFQQLYLSNGRLAEAVSFYSIPQHLLHNPDAGDDMDGITRYFEDYFAKFPKPCTTKVFLDFENNLVVLEIRFRTAEGEKLNVSIFRIEDGEMAGQLEVTKSL